KRIAPVSPSTKPQSRTHRSGSIFLYSSRRNAPVPLPRMSRDRIALLIRGTMAKSIEPYLAARFKVWKKKLHSLFGAEQCFELSAIPGYHCPFAVDEGGQVQIHHQRFVRLFDYPVAPMILRRTHTESASAFDQCVALLANAVDHFEKGVRTGK